VNPGLLLVKRSIIRLLKNPTSPLSGLGMSLFFLIVYNAGIGGVGDLPQFGGSGYFAFLFPLGIVSLSMGSAAGSGLTLYDDIRTGYFKRLFLSPIPRWSFAAAPLTADGAATLLASIVLILTGLLFGLPLRFGIYSFLGILLLSFFWCLFLSGLSAGVMLRTGNHQSAQLVTSAVFPLIFLSTTFMPRELITSRWLQVISYGNPVTYLLEGMRWLLGGTAPFSSFLAGICMTGAGALLAVLFALTGARKVLI